MLMTVDEFVNPEQSAATGRVYGVSFDYGYGGGKYSVEGKAGGSYYGYGSGNASGTCTPWYTSDGFGSGIGSGSGHGCGDGAGDSDGYGTGDCSGGR